ncbi:MAG TPA: hypothetical protein VMF06_16855 [Candidatus Limnocylindria bacterium]|jgi:hypothetical protein|nr:hypothetical protein [Candidatus Limnocylindria bacterium]
MLDLPGRNPHKTPVLIRPSILRWAVAMASFSLVGVGSSLLAAETAPASKPLFKDFMAINGHFTFKPELYRQTCRLARNYHSLNWDIKQPGDPITVPVCVNRVDWNRDVYSHWKKEGFETDLCIETSGFKGEKATEIQAWTGQEQWCHDYGKAMAAYFGPSGKQKLCTSIEIGNEPGAKFDQGLYKTIFKNMASGMREGDPKLKILTPAAQARQGNDYSQDLRGIYADKEILPLFDVINVHTYAEVPRTNPSESPWVRSFPEDDTISYLKVVDEVAAWRDKTAPGKEIWITEFGYDACTPEAMSHRDGWFQKLDWQGYTDLQQAQYLVRSFFAFAERDVQRAYIYFYDDNDSAAVHGASGLTRKFIPKPSFWAVKQLYETLGDYRFHRVVKKAAGELYVYEFEKAGEPTALIWVAWSPTGTRTNSKTPHTPREAKVTLTGLPVMPSRVVGLAVNQGAAPAATWTKAGAQSIEVTVGESPLYIVMDHVSAGK